LDAGVRAQFEQALKHDFGSVRIHGDRAAASAAEASGALAYTVGRDIVFGAGRYAPRRREGARLLAHELVHVVQQGVAPRLSPARDATGGVAAMGHADARAGRSRAGRSGDAFEQEADQLANQVAFAGAASRGPRLRGAAAPQLQASPRLLTGELRAPPPPPGIMPGSIPEAFIVPDLPAPPRLELSGSLGGAPARPLAPSFGARQLTGPAPFTPMLIIPVARCVPDRPLIWADFPGTMPANAGFSGETVVTQPLSNVQGNPMYQLRLQPGSRVKAKYRNPANRATNGCAAPVAACRNFLNHNPGGNWSFQAPAQNPCPASILPSTALQATTPAECDTVLGAECDQAAQAESARLLAHEQGHFDLGCALVNKADNALRAGGTTATITPALNSKMRAQQAAYDNQTNHGCNAGPQAAWVAAIAGGLPAVTIP
jgi:hypothetical protein